MRTAFLETLFACARQDPRIMLLTGDLGFSVLEPFARTLPNQYLNVGVAEQNMIGIAAGLAREGFLPFVYSIANFPTLRCLEQIRNDVCYHELPVTIVSVGGGLSYGPQGYTHHGVEDLGILRLLPNIRVFAPADPVEVQWLVETILSTPAPGYLRLGKANEPVLHPQRGQWSIGQLIQVRAGSHGAILSTGGTLGHCLETAKLLAVEGLNLAVYSVPTLKPFDGIGLEEIARSQPFLLTVEEHSRLGGLGTICAEVIAEMPVPVRWKKLALPDEPFHVAGTQNWLREKGLGSLAEAIRRLGAA